MTWSPWKTSVLGFTTAAMSLGALSPEAHECLAIAMNRIRWEIQLREGGEDAERFTTRENGDNACSAIKQVASGRFGVTPEYLASAQEIEIKVAREPNPEREGGYQDTKSSIDCPTATQYSGCPADFSATAPRYLLYRRSGAAHLRPQTGQSSRQGVCQTRGLRRSWNRCCRCCQGVCRCDSHQWQ